MAYLRILQKQERRYYYICRSERKGTKVRAKVLEYLGRDPNPAKLKRACQYWGVRRGDSAVKRAR